MNAWKRIEPTKITKVGWRKVVSKTFEMPNGNRVIFDILHPDGQEFTTIIALTPDKKVVIARQFRPGPEKVMDELPGGFVDEGEAREASVKRELLEETGYKAGTLEYLGVVHKDTLMNARWHIFLAKACTPQADQDLEDEKDVEIGLISITELLENAKNDKMTDHGAVLLAYDQLRQLEQEEKHETAN